MLSAAVAVATMSIGDQNAPDTTACPLGFSDLNGWDADDHEAALRVFLTTCADINRTGWQSICGSANATTDAKAFFEAQFLPIWLRGGTDALFTGYYEPELQGSRTRSKKFSHAVYALPKEIREGTTWLTRREILETSILHDRGLELAWVDDPVSLFFLQVQGSGRIRFEDGSTMRVGYAGKNGQPYRSIGKELIRRGVFAESDANADAIGNWVRQNPKAGQDLLCHNPSYVFFREVSHVPADMGPLGAMDRSVTPLRSIAVDPRHVTLGGPVWIESNGSAPLNRLMIAQDIGSAIKGAERADIFFGTGDDAGKAAGRTKDGGRLIQLWPRHIAEKLL